MLEALPMAGFMPGNITDGPCGVSVSSGAMSFDRLTRKGQEVAFKAQALDLATGKSEHFDLDPIGIYKLKIGEGTYRHRVTNEIIEEQTLISADFGGEPIGVWTSAGENGLGTKEEYEKVVGRARSFAQTDGEAAMFWVSPGNASLSGKPEHRAYLWKKDKNNEVTAYAYQLSGSRESLGRMMKKLDYHNGEKQIEEQVIFTVNHLALNSEKVFNSYIDSLTKEEKEKHSSHLDRFRQELQISDAQRLEKLESGQKKYENELKAVYQGDIASALKSVLHGMLSLALEGVRDHPVISADKKPPQFKDQAPDSGKDGELICRESSSEENSETRKADTNKVLFKSPNPDRFGRENLLDIFVGKNRVQKQDRSKQIKLLRKVLMQTVVLQEGLDSKVNNLSIVKPDGIEAITFPNTVVQMDLQKLSRPVAPFQLGNGDYSGVVGKDEESGKLIGVQLMKMLIIKKTDFGETGEGAGGNLLQEIRGVGEKTVVKDNLIKPVEKAIIALSVVAELTEIWSLNLPEEKTGENPIISDAQLDAVYSDFKKALENDFIKGIFESENPSDQPTERIMSNPVILLKIYYRFSSKEERILVAVLMSNWLNGDYRKNANWTRSKNATAEIRQRDLQLWEIKKSKYGKILAWLIEAICVARKQDYSLSEIELLTEIVLLLCLLADRQDLLNMYISLKNKGTVFSDSRDRLRLERKPAALNISGTQSFSLRTKPKKIKRNGIIYHYLGPLFVPCQAEVKYDKI